MKKTKIIIAICAVILIVGAVAAAAAYDPSNDPFVSLSYLEKVFKPQLVEELSGQGQTVSPGASSEYAIEHLTKGQRIEAAGSCEVILRSGMAQALVTSEANIANKVGLSNITAGTEVLNGEEVALNNYIIIPRADGRAVVTVSEDAYYMVRGEYTVVTDEE